MVQSQPRRCCCLGLALSKLTWGRDRGPVSLLVSAFRNTDPNVQATHFQDQQKVGVGIRTELAQRRGELSLIGSRCTPCEDNTGGSSRVRESFLAKAGILCDSDFVLWPLVLVVRLKV